MKDKVIIITGPTASGKSSLALKLAKDLNGEIISADSQQIYKDMDIGTNKVSKEEMDGIAHHILDIKNPNESYSVKEFKNQARELIKSINKNNKLAIIAGGTGFYIDSILFDMNYGQVKKDDKLRKKLDDLADKNGNDYLYKRLVEIDEKEAKKYHPNERNRVIRALETFKLSGKKPSELRKGSKKLNEEIDPILFFINYENRNLLYEKINNRVIDMLNLGLVDEFNKLIDKYSLDEKSKSLQAIGYKEIFLYKNNEINKDELVDLIQKNTRHYAKRQITWMKRYLDYDFSKLIYKESINYKEILEKIKEEYDL